MQVLLNANAPAGFVSTLRLDRLPPDSCQRWIAKFPCLNALQLHQCGIPSSLSLLSLDSLSLVNSGIDFSSPLSHALFGRRLREIDLSSNALRRIPLSFFESVPNLEKLNFSSNLLSSLAPLSLLQNLKHLDLSHNQFQYAPATVIDRRPWLWSILHSNSCIVNPTEDLIASPASPVITVPSLKALSATAVAQEALQSTLQEENCTPVINYLTPTLVQVGIPDLVEFMQYDVLFCDSTMCKRRFYGSRTKIFCSTAQA